jgi:hypothetical protein
MTSDEFRQLLKKHDLRQSDVAWMTGVGLRAARSWALGEFPVPQASALLLIALDEQRISRKWLEKNIDVEAPQ